MLMELEMITIENKVEEITILIFCWNYLHT